MIVCIAENSPFSLAIVEFQGESPNSSQQFRDFSFGFLLWEDFLQDRLCPLSKN